MGILGITNDGSNDMVVAGRVIVPGETRHFDEHEVPLALRPAVAAPKAPPVEPLDPLQRLQGESVNTVKEVLPTLEAAQLVELYLLEEASEKPRSTLLAAIQEDQLRRANESSQIGL